MTTLHHPIPAFGASLEIEDLGPLLALVMHTVSDAPGDVAPGGEGGGFRAELDPGVLGAAQRGDPRATRQVVDALWPRVRHLARFLVRGDADADDAAQEGMLAILRGLETYRGDGALRSWADRVVARATFGYLERTRRDLRRLPDVRTEVGARTFGVVDAPRPVGELYGARRDLARALDEVPPLQRKAVVLHHVVGMTIPELAELERVPFDTMKSRVQAGLRHLRTSLTQEAASAEEEGEGR